jgi:ABC-type bacteriocin/lantibiotic exporter with double-glycine peptidase domain
VWLTRLQWTTVLQGTVCDVVWLLGLALTPWAIGQAIDQGLVAGDPGAFAVWMVVVLWLQLQHSLIQGLRDRAGSINFSRAESRVGQVLAHTSARVTVAADRALHPGAVVTMASESWPISFLPINVGSFVSALVSFVTVAVLLLRESVLLGVMVLVGVPLFATLSFVLVKSLHARQSASWDARAAMNTVALDSVKGLRVLRGVGGERRFLQRFREDSAIVRETGVRVAWPLAVAEAMNVVIAGMFVAALTWIGAVLVMGGHLQVGALVAFYGYAGFLLLPVSLFNQVLTVAVAAHVTATKLVELLRVEPLWKRDAAAGAPAPDPRAVLLEDTATGLRVGSDELLGVVVLDAGEARAFVDRLGLLASTGPGPAVRWCGTALSEIPVPELRRRIVVADPVPFLFSGTLRELLDPWSRHDDAAILVAVEDVDATDIVDAVEGGLDVLVGERGVEFSGGQRQRLGAARALLASPELLVMHEPASAVDAPTEERMASGIRRHRSASATAIVTTSPLVLARADRVVLLRGDRVVAEGRHESLLDVADYRAVVLRAEGVR